MKKILKFLLLPVFILSPTITVVACGSNNNPQIANQDILNSAVGRMQNHIFNMTELGLQNLPADKLGYDKFSDTAKGKITNYYKELVEPGLNWDYPAVDVEVTANKDSSPFLTKYGLNVESRINLTAHLTYKSLTASKDIVIKISNDETNHGTKIKAIGTYLEKYLENNESSPFPFKTLFKDELMSNNDTSAAFAYGQIQASLRNSLFIATKENPIPVIDVEGVDMYIQGPDTPNSIYSLEKIDAANKVIIGNLKNLTLTIAYNSSFSYSLKDKSFKITQSFTDTNNQIARILNQGEQSLQFSKADLVDQKLPTDNQTLETYDSDKQFQNKVAEKMFNFIKIVFPKEKMQGSDTWNASKIVIENAALSPYNKVNDSNGYFIVNIKFSFKVDDDSIIEASLGALKLNLNNLG